MPSDALAHAVSDRRVDAGAIPSKSRYLTTVRPAMRIPVAASAPAILPSASGQAVPRGGDLANVPHLKDAVGTQPSALECPIRPVSKESRAWRCTCPIWRRDKMTTMKSRRNGLYAKGAGRLVDWSGHATDAVVVHLHVARRRWAPCLARPMRLKECGSATSHHALCPLSDPPGDVHRDE